MFSGAAGSKTFNPPPLPPPAPLPTDELAEEDDAPPPPDEEDDSEAVLEDEDDAAPCPVEASGLEEPPQEEERRQATARTKLRFTVPPKFRSAEKMSLRSIFHRPKCFQRWSLREATFASKMEIIS